MLRTKKTMVLGLMTAGIVVAGAGASFAAGTPGTTTHTKTTVAQDQARYDAFVTKVDARMETVKTKVAASSLTADQKTTLTNDANKVETDASTVKAKVDAATTKAEIKAAHTGHPVKADLVQLRTDAKAAGLHADKGMKAGIKKGAKASTAVTTG